MAIASMIGLQLLAIAACDSAGQTIRIPITDPQRAGFSRSFSVDRTAVYAVGLEFPAPTSDREVDQLVDLAGSKVGFPGPPAFDFTWRVVEGAATIGQGRGEDGATGTIHFGDGTFGSDRLTARALLFGTFDACAGRTYTVHFSPGPGLLRVLRASPVMLIHLHRTLDADGRLHDDGPRLKQRC